MSSEQWLQVISIGSNLAVLGLVVRATKAWTLIEFKVDEMWKVFNSKFERRGEEFVERPHKDRNR